MNTKAKIKWTLDVLMTAALFFLMGYQFWGETAHEWIGAGMLVLFVVHQVLNRSWYKNLFRGRYTPMRTLQCLVNVLTLAAMLALMYSGITMSRHVFAFLPIRGGLMLARRLHILGSYWGYLLMSLHLGLQNILQLACYLFTVIGKIRRYRREIGYRVCKQVRAYLQVIDQDLQFTDTLFFSGRDKQALLCHLIQFRVWKKRERVHGNKIRIEPAEQFCAVPCILVSAAFSCKACHIDKIVFYACFV